MQLSAVLLCFSSDTCRFYFICKQYNAVPFSSPKHQTLKFLAVESQQHWSEVLAWDKLHFLHWTMPCNNIDSVPLDARNNTYNDLFYSNSIKIFSRPHCAQIPQWSMYTMRKKVSVWLFQILWMYDKMWMWKTLTGYIIVWCTQFQCRGLSCISRQGLTRLLFLVDTCIMYTY